jgi:HD-like signal output (HDOD) protein
LSALAERTQKRLESISDIPALPAVLARVWELTSKEDSSAADLGKAIGTDPGLTGAVLRLANSAYFGFPRKVSTVTQAIVILGFSTVKSLVAGASVFRSLKSSNAAGIDGGSFLRHSLAVAMGSRILVEQRAPQKAGTAFACGILHDVGKLVIAEFLGDAMQRIAERVRDGEPRDVAETAVLGLTHSDIGSWFATRWNFPEELTSAVRWHHHPAEATVHREFVASVHVADVLAHRHGVGADVVREDPTLDERALAILGITGADCARAAAAMTESGEGAQAVGLTREG